MKYIISLVLAAYILYTMQPACAGPHYGMVPSLVAP